MPRQNEEMATWRKNATFACIFFFIITAPVKVFGRALLYSLLVFLRRTPLGDHRVKEMRLGRGVNAPGEYKVHCEVAWAIVGPSSAAVSSSTGCLLEWCSIVGAGSYADPEPYPEPYPEQCRARRGALPCPALPCPPCTHQTWLVTRFPSYAYTRHLP